MNSKCTAFGSLLFAGLIAITFWWPAKRPSSDNVPAGQTSAPSVPALAIDREPPAASSTETAPSESAPALDSAAVAVLLAALDPQAELETTIPFAARVLESGDKGAILKLTIPPGKITLEQETSLRASPPDARQRAAQLKLVALLDSIQEATQAVNETGDRVTYKFPGGEEIYFIKIEGRWYAAGTGGVKAQK